MGSCVCKRRRRQQYDLQTAIDGVEDKKESLENEIEKYEQQLNETK